MTRTGPRQGKNKKQGASVGAGGCLFAIMELGGCFLFLSPLFLYEWITIPWAFMIDFWFFVFLSCVVLLLLLLLFSALQRSFHGFLSLRILMISCGDDFDGAVRIGLWNKQSVFSILQQKRSSGFVIEPNMRPFP
jgi:hypothetical protein